MTTSFFIRPTKTLAGKIYVLISEGRGHQFRFSTGHEVKHVSHWNDNTQLVRTVAAESHDIINHQLKRLKAHIETELYQAKPQGRRRNKAFYEAVMSSFSVMEGEAPKAVEKTPEMAFERYLEMVLFQGRKLTLLKQGLNLPQNAGSATLWALNYFQLASSYSLGQDLNILWNW